MPAQLIDTQWQGGKMGEDTKWVKEFAKCPQCGSDQRMFEQIGKEMKERSLIPQDELVCFESRQGAMANQNVIAKLPIGAEIPAFAVATDFCSECGCFYAVKLERANAKKTLAPVQLVPNRAQRRAGLQGGSGFQLPPLNNAGLS